MGISLLSLSIGLLLATSSPPVIQSDEVTCQAGDTSPTGPRPLR